MLKFSNNKQFKNNKRHSIGSYREQPLFFSLVHLILCWVKKERT
jgi:hypothetical protein